MRYARCAARSPKSLQTYSKTSQINTSSLCVILAHHFDSRRSSAGGNGPILDPTPLSSARDIKKPSSTISPPIKKRQDFVIEVDGARKNIPINSRRAGPSKLESEVIRNRKRPSDGDSAFEEPATVPRQVSYHHIEMCIEPNTPPSAPGRRT